MADSGFSGKEVLTVNFKGPVEAFQEKVWGTERSLFPKQSNDLSFDETKKNFVKSRKVLFFLIPTFMQFTMSPTLQFQGVVWRVD